MTSTPHHPALVSRLYRAGLRLFPPSFRIEYAAETASVFEASCRQARRRLSRLGLWVYVLRAFADLAFRLVREWSDHSRSRRGPAAPVLSHRQRQRMGMDHLWLDVRSAVRSLRRHPGFAAVVIGTLGLGIGANAAIFSIVDGVLLRPLPYPDADRIVTIAEVAPSIDIAPKWASIPNYIDWRNQTSSFSAMAVFRGRSMSITGAAEPLYAYGVYISHEFLEAVGVAPLLGRSIREDEVGPNPAPVVLISYGLWTRRYGADSSLLGGTIEVDGQPLTVIGIMPQGFDAPADWIGVSLPVDVWRPFALDPAREARLNRSNHVVGRLGPGVTIAQARTDLTLIGARLREAHPEANRDWELRILTWQDVMVGDVRSALGMLTAMVACILIIACANVANLLLNRMLSRRTEIAVRAALGAGRGQLMRHILTESLVLAVLGGVLGLALAAGLLYLVTTLDPGAIPLADRVRLNGRVLVATLGVSLATGLAFGVLPAAYGARATLSAALSRGSSRVAGGRHQLRNGLVIAQLMLAFSLLVGAGLLGRSLRQLMTVNVGFAPDGVIATTVALSWNRVETMDARARFVREVLDELRQIPGVTSAAMVNSLPLSGSNSWQAVWRDGEPLGDPSRQPVVAFRGVSPEYFETMEIPILAGRVFEPRDLERPITALVNRTAAEALWPDQDPIGQSLLIRGGDDTLTVVGVVGDVRHFGLESAPRPELYQPYTDEYLTSKSFIVRAAGSRGPIIDGIRMAIRRVDPDQPIREIRTMDRWIGDSVARPRFNAVILAVGSGLALALAAVGLFAVISYSVTERRREIGVRLALGAFEMRIARSFVARGIALAGLGVLGGAGLALAMTRVMRSFLFGISAHDPATYLVLGAVFLLLAALASYLPARRASRTDPVETLRQ